jgi:hypothetical protein
MEDDVAAWIKQWIDDFVAHELEAPQIDAWVARTTRAIVQDVPDLADRPGLLHVIELGIHEHWLAFLEELGRAEMRFRLVPSAERVAREAASTSLPLETVGRFYRVAQRATWRYITTLISDFDSPQPHRTELLIYLWERAAEWIDRSIDASISVYQEARRRIETATHAQRYETVAGLLRGEVDMDSRSISATLGGYAFTACNTAFVLACEDHRAVGGLEELGRDLARRAGVSQPLIVRPGGQRIWMWIATQSEPRADFGHEFRRVDRGSARVAVGPSRSGLRGFVDSHHLAGRTLSTITGGDARLLNYESLELMVLLGCTPEVDAFVHRAIGGLLGDTPHLQRLRQTLECFLRHGGSVEQTAQELVVHRNTVRYRIGQAEELLHEGLMTASAEVAVALRHVEVCHRSASRATPVPSVDANASSSAREVAEPTAPSTSTTRTTTHR